MTSHRAITGRVVAFDDARGLGEIEADDGRRLSFHCTAVADGTRTIPVDVRVVFDLVAGPTGAFEAGSVRAI